MLLLVLRTFTFLILFFDQCKMDESVAQNDPGAEELQPKGKKRLQTERRKMQNREAQRKYREFCREFMGIFKIVTHQF